jgi:3-deoxy-7-phosphoheptulonate synthase
MILILRKDVSDPDREALLLALRRAELRAEEQAADGRRVVFVTGPAERLRELSVDGHPAVERALPLTSPHPLVSRKTARAPVRIGAVAVGAGQLTLMAGPCAVEDRALLGEIAAAVRGAGAVVLRGGAFKPRTSPYAFRGLGEEGLRMLREVGDELGLPVLTEVLDPRHLELVSRWADALQIGARNMQNFPLLVEAGRARKPVVLKRGMGSTVKELLLAAEYILAEGNDQVILCERGIRTFEDSVRHLLDVAALAQLRETTTLPVIADPSHAAGRADLVPAVARAAVAAGAEGLLVEVHTRPERALSDGPQALTPEAFRRLAREVTAIHQALRERS